jgi:hypothetical protein
LQHPGRVLRVEDERSLKKCGKENKEEIEEWKV